MKAYEFGVKINHPTLSPIYVVFEKLFEAYTFSKKNKKSTSILAGIFGNIEFSKKVKIAHEVENQKVIIELEHNNLKKQLKTSYERNVLILGSPETGKTYLSNEMSSSNSHHSIIHSDSYLEYGYVEALYHIIKDIESMNKPFLIEGTQGYRLLRKSLQKKMNLNVETIIEVDAPILQVQKVYEKERADKNIKYLKSLQKVHETILSDYFHLLSEQFLELKKPIKWIFCYNKFNLENRLKEITVRVPLSSSPLWNAACFAEGDLRQMEEKEFITIWKNVLAANYMFRLDIYPTDYKHGKNHHVLYQAGDVKLVEKVNEEFKRRGLDKKYSIFLTKKDDWLQYKFGKNS
ncbi:MAG: hypothetical protein MUC49_21130 [Raineya sp.]|jgi:adenylate kinase family enzyme|nr:hypothetical protein [Raineya sp.]